MRKQRKSDRDLAAIEPVLKALKVAIHRVAPKAGPRRDYLCNCVEDRAVEIAGH